jgi:FAD synthase
MTFDPPPDALLRPRQKRQRIVSHAKKCELLVRAGADWVVTVPTDMKLLSMEPEAFIQEIILSHYAVRTWSKGIISSSAGGAAAMCRCWPTGRNAEA